MELKDYIGKPSGAGNIHLERGSVSRFARAVTDENPVYHNKNAAQEAGFDNCPLPPTWTFASEFLGVWPEDKPADPTNGAGNPLMKIIGNLTYPKHRHTLRQIRICSQHPTARQSLNWAIKMNNLTARMHPCVSSSRANHGDRAVCDHAQSLLQRLLQRDATILRLPAAVLGAVILDG